MRNYKERGLTQKPLNVPMKYMFKPGMKDAYKDWLNAKQDYRKSMVLVRKTLDGNSLVNEINFQEKRLHNESVKAAYKAKYKQWKSLKNQSQSQVTLNTIHGKESLDEKAKSSQDLLTQSSLSSSKSLPDPQSNIVPLSGFKERRQAWNDQKERIRQQEIEREQQRKREQEAQQKKQAELADKQQLERQLEQQRIAEIERKAAEAALLKQQQLEQQRQREIEEQHAQKRRRDRRGPH